METAYLTKSVLARKNLTVAIHAQVTKILTIKKEGALRTVGVEFQNKRGGSRFRARAKREVVVWYAYQLSIIILRLTNIR